MRSRALAGSRAAAAPRPSTPGAILGAALASVAPDAALDGALRDRVSGDFLEGIQALAREMEASIGAIARNDLDDFEEIIRRQEVLCVGLAGMFGLHKASEKLRGDFAPAHQGVASNFAGPFAGEIGEALSSLEYLSRCNHALLRHAGRSVELLGSLCCSYLGKTYTGLHPQKYLSRAPNAGSNDPTWDCEI
jgi:hypothetical protein